MNGLFIKANLNIILGLVALIFSFFLSSGLSINLYLVTIFIILDLYFFRIAAEYQRITLVIGRCIRAEMGFQDHLLVFYIQTLLASPFFGILLFIETIIFGIIAGYILRINLLAFFILFFVKYFAISLIHFLIPHKFLFAIIDKQVVRASKEILLSGEALLMSKLLSVYKQMPHNRTYEAWAYKIFGNIY